MTTNKVLVAPLKNDDRRSYRQEAIPQRGFGLSGNAEFVFWFNHYNRAYPSHVARYLAYRKCFGGGRSIKAIPL